MKKIQPKTKRIIGVTIAAIVAVVAIACVYNKWLSRTRVGFVNYQVISLGEIARANDNPFITLEEVPLDKLSQLDRYDMVMVNAMGLRLTEAQREEIQLAGWTGTPILTTMATNPDNYIVSVDSITADTLNAYLRGGTRQNYRSMLHYIRTYVDRKIVSCGEVQPVAAPPSGLLSHPDLDHPDEEDVYFDDIASYETYLTQHGRLKEGAPCILVAGAMGNPHDLILALEEKGYAVYRIGASPAQFFAAMEQTPLRFAAMINLAHGRLGDKAVEWLAAQNCPLFCPLNVNTLVEDWEADKHGMQGGFMSQSIVTPEIDGALRPYVLFGQRLNSEGLHEEYVIPERLATFTATIDHYVRLQQLPNRDKRLAIVYFKGPGEHALTASGLDVVASLYHVLQRLAREGYDVTGLPASPAALADLIQRKGTPVSDPVVLEAHPDTVVRIELGHIALLPQPLAAHGDNTFQIIHGTDNDPVAEFQNAYQWIQNQFHADALIHFGTHGGLEYTPRKQTALCRYDWPDRLVGALPHFYIYTIGNVGEALIAKRRTYAGIQSHLSAPYLESGLRDTYKQLSEAVAAYNKTPSPSASLRVKEIAVSMGIHRDLGLDSLPASPWTEEQIAKVEQFGEELANEKIVGQLYTLGVPYEESRLVSTVYAMATDPIAYSLFSLDKQLGRVSADADKHKTLFTQRYLVPAKALVSRLMTQGGEVSDAFICQTARLTPDQLTHAREVYAAQHAPVDMMSMMLRMSAAKQQASVDTLHASVPAAMQGKKVSDPRKALQMAKMAGASPEVLKKMAAAMGLGGKASDRDQVSGMMQQMAAARPSYSQQEIYLAEAVMEVEHTLKNVRRYREQLVEAPEAELSSLLNALAGGYTRPSSGGDVVANPRALPTGRNLYGINAENTPSAAAWEKGKMLADNTLRLYQQHHNDSLPRKVSFTFWSSEFIETEGATLAQAFYLLGVEPVRDVFGRVTDLRLIPSEELGRPRVDVVVQTSGQLRDLAASRLYLLNRAVQLAAEAHDEAFANGVHEGVLESERLLTAAGLSPKEAREMSTYRIFGGLQGGYGTGIQAMVQQGERWQNEAEIADTYLNNMSAFYGSEEDWEKASKAVFQAALSRTDAVVQPRQSNAWGALSLDHVYEFMGGMNLAVRHVTGKDPDAYFADYRNRNNNRMQDLKEAIGVESRSTIFNPTYIKEKMKGGANEAASFAEVVENTYGWNVMKPAAIDNELWDKIYDVYVDDKMGLGIDKFIRQQNPAAMEQMAHTMVQTIEKGLWKTSAQRLETLQRLETELHQEAEAQMRDRLAEAQTSQQGVVMKKETLTDAAETSTTFVTTSVVAGVALVAVLLLVFVIRRRRQQREED